MNHDELEPMDPEMAALLGIKKPMPRPPDDVRERVLAHVVGHVVLPPSGGGGGGGSAVTSSLARRPLAWLAATFTAGAIVGGALLHQVAPERVVYADRPTPAAVAPVVPPPWNAVPEPAPPPTPAPSSEAPAASPVRAARPVDSSDLDSKALAAQRALLDVARAALSRGEAANAIEVVKRDAVEFPNGKLAEEREAILIRALVQVGSFDEARDRATRFHARYPDSISGRAVDSAIRSIP